MITPIDKRPELDSASQFTSKITSLNMPLNMQGLKTSNVFFTDDLKEKSKEH